MRDLRLSTLLIVLLGTLSGCGDSDPASPGAAERPGAGEPPGAAAGPGAANGAANGAASGAASGAAGPGGAVPAPSEGELLLASAPPGWVETAAMTTPALRMAEYGPRDEDDGQVERVTFESQSASPLPDPLEFVIGVSSDLSRRCNDYEHFNIFSGEENGYPTSVRLMLCGEFKDSPHGQALMTKAIRGSEQFYIVTRRRLVPRAAAGEGLLSTQAMADWSAFFRRIGLCDTRDGQHPCPQSPLPQ